MIVGELDWSRCAIDSVSVRRSPTGRKTPLTMALLAEHNVTTTPGRRVLEIHDADAHLGDETAMDAAETQVVAGNGYHLYLLSLQADMKVQIPTTPRKTSSSKPGTPAPTPNAPSSTSPTPVSPNPSMTTINRGVAGWQSREWRQTSRAVRRVLFPGSLAGAGATAIHLGPVLPPASCGLPADSGGQPSIVRAEPLFTAAPLDLAPGGVYLAA